MSDPEDPDTEEAKAAKAALEAEVFAEDEEYSEESEPYLGPAWAVVMFVLYLLKEAFPAEQYTLLWWFQIYVIVLVIAITVFTLLKRHQYYRGGEQEKDSKDDQSA